MSSIERQEEFARLLKTIVQDFEETASQRVLFDLRRTMSEPTGSISGWIFFIYPSTEDDLTKYGYPVELGAPVKKRKDKVPPVPEEPEA